MLDRTESLCVCYCYTVLLRSSRALEFPIVIVYLIVNLSITIKYSALKMVHYTHNVLEFDHLQ